jgi:aerotaxis receptor
MRVNMPVTNEERVFGEEEGLISRTDTKGRITFVNDAFERISGFSREELIGQPHNLLRHPDIPEEAFADLWDTLKKGEPWTAVIKNRCKNGDFYWVEANVTPLRDGDQIIGYISIRNKPARDAIAAAERLYREMKAGTCQYTVKEGKVVSKSLFAKMAWLKNPSIKLRLGFAIALPCLTVAITGAAALSGLMEQYTMEFILATVLSTILLIGFGLYTISNTMLKPLKELSLALSCAASGDFNRKIQVDNNNDDEIGKLLRLTGTMNRNMNRVLNNIYKSTDEVTCISQEMAESNANISHRIEQQAASLEETAASMEELTATVKSNTESAHQANQVAILASKAAMEGGAVVGQVVDTMGSISESSNKIVDIISVIDGIAFQTNILALNAAVEAARAGEQGRGFAVVATEVRNLAQRSALAAKEIKELINDSVKNVENGVELVDKTGKTMNEIVNSVKKVTDIMEEISSASQEQFSGINKVNEAVMEMDEITQQNSALVEESAAAAESMKDQTRKLMQAVLVFKLEGVQQANIAGRRMGKRPDNIKRLPNLQRQDRAA